MTLSLKLSDTRVYAPHLGTLGSEGGGVLSTSWKNRGITNAIARNTCITQRHFDNLLVPIQLTIEMMLVDQPCAMGV